LERRGEERRETLCFGCWTRILLLPAEASVRAAGAKVGGERERERERASQLAGELSLFARLGQSLDAAQQAEY